MHTCEICNEEFSSGVALGGHKASVHANESNCRFCGETFKDCRLSTHEEACSHNPEVKEFCKECGDLLTEDTQQKFCSRSCAAKYNNHLYPKRSPEGEPCLNCGYPTKSNQKKFCSDECCYEYKREQKFQVIEETGVADFDVKHYTNANWIKKYYIYKYGERCMKCGWNEENPYTGNVPVELDHIDGDHTNNTLENTRLLCPNCHSLTKNYKGANLGNGRSYRKKYHNKS